MEKTANPNWLLCTDAPPAIVTQPHYTVDSSLLPSVFLSKTEYIKLAVNNIQGTIWITKESITEEEKDKQMNREWYKNED